VGRSSKPQKLNCTFLNFYILTCILYFYGHVPYWYEHVCLVGTGLRTLGFKKVHLNACGRALNDHFRMRLTRDKIGNHARS
jgi:hypothetical protein